MDYSGKVFNDPVVRCAQCNKITHRAFISKYGGCVHCGNKRLTNVTGFEEEEIKALKSGEMEIGINKPYEIDPDYLVEFVEVDNAEVKD